jgi:hypothetical protein
MNLRTSAAALAAIALLAVPGPAAAAKKSKPAVREFTGTVASVAGRGRSFRLRRGGRAPVVVKISRRTRVAKGAKPRKGRKLVVRARRTGKGWLARSVKLVSVPADDNAQGDDESLGDDVEFGGDDQADGEDADPGLDLEDTLDDVLGDDSSGDEPE